MLLMLMLLMLTLMVMMMLMSMLVLTMLEMGFSVRSFSLPATTHCLGLSLTHNGGKELWLGDGIKDNRFVPTPVFSPSRVLLPPRRISLGGCKIFGWSTQDWHTLPFLLLEDCTFSCCFVGLQSSRILLFHSSSTNATRLSIVYFVSFYFYAHLSFTFFFEEFTKHYPSHELFQRQKGKKCTTTFYLLHT